MCKNNKTEQQIITEIRAQYMELRDLPRKSLVSSTKTLADDLYAKDTHFIFELIQNAEDNSYAPGVRPTLRFRLQEMDVDAQTRFCLIVENNETGFEEKHVTALCQVGQSTKSKEQGYIGEKGIGFKSVFRITDRPAIHSNGFHFELPKSDAETGLGYIVPVWDETDSVIGTPMETTIVLPLKPRIAPETVTTALRDIAPETILFLSKLRTIEIEVDLPGESYEIVIEKDDSRAPLVDLTHLKRQQSEEELETRRYWVAARQFEKPVDINQEKRQNVTTRTVSVAIPLDNGGENPGKLFAYLPIWERTGLPFLINADFLLVSSREGIHETEPWNCWLRDCIAPVYADAFMAIVGNESWPIEQRAQAYAFIPTASYQEWLGPVVGEIQKHLLQEACVLTSPNGALAKPEFCLQPSDAWRELLETPGRPPAALGNDFEFAHSAIAPCFADILNQIGVADLQAEDILACLRDTAWLEARTDEWFFRLFRELSCLEADTLEDVKIIPAVVLGHKNREILACTDHPVYFRPDKDGAKALRAIPAWLRKAKPVAFLPKPLQRLIDECDDHEKLREWITEGLGVYPFTPGKYCVDVLDYLQGEKDRIGKKQLIEATRFLVEHAAKDFDWKQLPIVLADGTRVTVAEARELTWNGGEYDAPVPVQALVVPESYDPEAGWQHIWRTDEDRQHFRYLSTCYPRDVADGLTRRGVIDSVPCFRTGQSRHTPRSVSEVVIKHFAPSALTAPDCRVSGAVVRWLGSKPGKRSVRWPGNNKRPFSGPREPEYEWAMDLTYYERGNSLYHVQTGPYQFRCEHSEIVHRLRQTAWLPTTKGLVRPSLVFLPKPETREVLGDTVPYFEGNLSEALLDLLGVNVNVTVETLLNRLDACRDDPAMDAKLPERIYRQLFSRSQDGDNSGLRGKFRDRPLVFCPERESGQQWLTSKDCVWRDARELFGDAFGYLEQAYPRLRDFFVETLGVKANVDTESYARRWLQLQTESPSADGSRRQVVAMLYRELRQALKMDPQPHWLGNFLRKAQVYTQTDTFEDPAYVVVPDDGNLKRLFSGDVSFAWRPEHDAFAEWQPLYEALKTRRLSECVHTELDQKVEAGIVSEGRLLTSAAVQMIASWLREKEKSAYERLLKDGVFKRLFQVREEQAQVPLQVVYTLDGMGNAPCVKSEESPVFWDQDEFRLIRSSAKDVGYAKIDAANQITRFLLDSQEDKHGLSSWIELVFGEGDTRRLKNNNWSVPREILALSSNLALSSDEEVLEFQAKTGNAPLSPAPNTAASPARPPKPEAPSRSEPKAPPETPAYSTSPHCQPESDKSCETSRSEHDSGGTASALGADSNTQQEIDPALEEIAKLKNDRQIIESTARKDRPTFPARPVANPERRQERLGEQLSDAPDKEYEKRERSVQVPTEITDEIIKTWLRNQYVNDDEQMVCQICKMEHFRKRNGEHHFEKKEVLTSKFLPKKLVAQYLALCPLCAAKYDEFVKTDDEVMAELRDRIVSSDLCEIPISLGDEKTSIRFVETHLHDLKNILEEMGQSAPRD